MINDTIYEYEQTLISQSSQMPEYLFDYQPIFVEKIALTVFKYVIEEYLHWTPEEAAVYLTYDVVKKMKLEQLLNKIRFPCEYNPTEDLVYVVGRIYPDKIKIRNRERVLSVYKKVLSGKLIRLPKAFASCAEGESNACICLMYILEQNFAFKNIEEMYAYFITTDCKKKLREYRLLNVQKELFPTPLDYLHTALPFSQKSELFYHKYNLILYENELKAQNRKKSKTKEITTDNKCM